MAESTLSLALADLEAEVGRYLGWGRGAGFSEPAWDSRQQADITAILKSGLRQFYFPPPMGQVGGYYRWSFLRPTATLTLAAAGSTVDLPDDFGGFEGDLSVGSAGIASYANLPLTNEAFLRERYAVDATVTGWPKMAAVRPIKGVTLAEGQRFQLYVYPVADQQYTLSGVYYVHPDALTSLLPYHYGGMAHAETVRAAVLMAAEEFLDDSQVVWAGKFQQRLAASIKFDMAQKPQRLGYNGENTENRMGMDRRFDIITFDGYAPS